MYVLLNTSNKIVNEYHVFRNQKFKERVIRNRHLYFPVTINANANAVVFVCIDSRGQGLIAPIRLTTRNYRIVNESAVYSWYAFYTGILAFVAFFSFISFMLYHERIYLYYAMYVVFCGLFLLAECGLDYEWLYPEWFVWIIVAPTIYAVGIVIFRLSFMSNFLYLKGNYKTLYNIAMVWRGLVTSLILVIPLGYISAENFSFRPFVYTYAGICFLGEWVIHIIYILILLWNRYKPVYIYAISIISVFTVTLLYNLHTLGIVKTNQLPYNYMMIGLVIEIIFLSFALVFKFNSHKRNYLRIESNFQKEILKTKVEIQEITLKNISQEIHDNIGQVLSLVSINLNTLAYQDDKKLVYTDALVTKAIKDLSYLSRSLNPDRVKRIGVVEAIRYEVDQLNMTGKFKTWFNLLTEIDLVDDNKALIVYRMIQEAFHNIIKHANASEITVTVNSVDDRMIISITDNGVGFDSKTAEHEGIGLQNIRSRAQLINSTVKIFSAINLGTTVTFEIGN